MMRVACLASLIALSLPGIAAATDPLRTVAEQSGFQRTGRYDEVIALCERFAKTFPEHVRCDAFGKTPEGRPMQYLVVSRSGAMTPEAAREKGLPVLLVQGGIHAGEIDGKDAGFQLLRELLTARKPDPALEKLVLVFIPVFNVDGHERFGRWNRMNQRGPEEMGWRTTAQNFNLNRDYLKAETPEMHAMLGLMGHWDPVLYVDLHVTDGAQFEHDISIQVEPVHSGDATLRAAGRALRDDTAAALAKQGSLPLTFYPSFVVNDDPASGFADTVAPPRFSTGYMPLRNRFGLLVETHSWRTYPERVRTTRNTVLNLIHLTAERGASWRQLQAGADQRAAALGGSEVPLDYHATDKTRTIDFRGYAYTRTPSEISGVLMTRYDETKPQIWKIPLRDEVVPGTVVTAPKAGYIVPPAHARLVGEKLAAHGVQFQVIDTAQTKAPVSVFRANRVKFSSEPNESHHRATLEGAWKAESRDIAAGALFVPLSQAKSRIAVHLLEPVAGDSLAAWGWFNGNFEQKEYMEEYVAEAIARDMLKKDAALAAEFNRKLEDPEFAKDRFARLSFFAQRHTSWDDQLNLYPVYRTDVVPAAVDANK
ncbi:M14 family metallopeptidase [Tahibacter amnicola]|uniref:M14 family metallopeptidase n=1 Tax=Tahibacter amnicola TaxID=2976241 RepID=A0ABY6B9Y1_9GAMM|nr:M14 family metallopeptidase [Tahibacter amnicola]UXI66674.1 M14 family metallopeptidase [Tahibacter amnicola]